MRSEVKVAAMVNGNRSSRVLLRNQSWMTVFCMLLRLRSQDLVDLILVGLSPDLMPPLVRLFVVHSDMDSVTRLVGDSSIMTDPLRFIHELNIIITLDQAGGHISHFVEGKISY